jgi:GNAT superfamily N-acetyltransferase
MKSEGVVIRPWERGDFALLAAAAPRLSERTLWLRFWGAVPTLPAGYLRSTEQRWPAWWDAVAALDGYALVGWAEYGRYPQNPQTADVAVCVVDDEQGRGIGGALLAALVERARGAGLVSVHADIAPHNRRALQGWQRFTGGRGSTLALAG